MKLKTGFKIKLNFGIKDANLDVQKRNLALYKTAVVVIFTFLVTFSPIFAYLSIFYHNVNFDLYDQYYPIISQHFSLPSKTLILGLVWTSFGVLVFSIVFISFFKPIVTMEGMSKNKQLLIVIGIILLMVLVFLLAGLSQYYYAQYETFFNYESMTEGDNKQEWIKELSAKLTQNAQNGIDLYHWQSAGVVWWILFYQFAVVFGLAVFLQNSIFSKSELLGVEQYIIFSLRKEGINNSSWTRRIGQLFKVSDKNLSIWLLLVAFIIVAPNFAYSILISVPGKNINALISWTYQVPNLVDDYQGAEGINAIYNQIMAGNRMSQPSSYFLLNSMPVIVVGLTFATTFFFISIMVRGQRNNQTIFVVQYFAMVIEILILISYFLYVKLYVESLFMVWSNPDAINGTDYLFALKNLVGEADYNRILELFPTGDIINGQKGQLEWWSSFEIISEALIGFSFTIVAFSGIGVGMLKSFKLNRAYQQEEKDKQQSLINAQTNQTVRIQQ